MASKLRFFFFFASKRVGEEGGRRGMRSSCAIVSNAFDVSGVTYLQGGYRMA
jgi:hypothetical protein